ncbi:hypothetical protein FH972_023139 [Carpinus fangiana]|uniref:RRM domain-containing protein n=1 Tax=Carpinus fangiana TaxID=176857 RepID=A0A5N6KUP0_9ROSI|nr:hypothetical protein FH972_023139 [Carpinus fangiana]
MAGDKDTRSVFIGNIPYGLTETQIIHTFSSAGQVLNFRLVTDKDTGRPKGFGFAEFADADAAASAVRNLNDFEIMGRRLRVDYSNDNNTSDSAPAGYNMAPPNGAEPNTSAASTLPTLPPGVDLPHNLTCPDAISRTLNTMPPTALLDVLTQMKGLVNSDPRQATELLSKAPQLSYAIFQALLLLGLVDTTVLASVVSRVQAVPHVPAPQPGYLPPYPVAAMQPGMQHAATPPMPPMPSHFPPQSQPQSQPPPPQIQLTPEQKVQLMGLSLEVINSMQPQQRSQILDLRARIQAGII